MYLKAFRNFLIWTVCLNIFISFGCKGQNIKSLILDERRTFFIHLPQGYELSDRDYPVLYVLDAYDQPSTFGPSFSETAKSVEGMIAEGIPPMIVVGIRNTDRSRDMLPIPSRSVPGNGGGADKFLSFMVEELIPFINQEYRTAPLRIRYGRSDSGLFVLHALAENPESFGAYISSSPSIGHCPEFLKQKFTELFARTPDIEKDLYITYGEKDIPLAIDFIPDFNDVLSAGTSPHLRYQLDIAPGEGHIPESSLHQGLHFIFLH